MENRGALGSLGEIRGDSGRFGENWGDSARFGFPPLRILYGAALGFCTIFMPGLLTC